LVGLNVLVVFYRRGNVAIFRVGTFTGNMLTAFARISD
jgi:hypothetical protein